MTKPPFVSTSKKGGDLCKDPEASMDGRILNELVCNLEHNPLAADTATMCTATHKDSPMTISILTEQEIDTTYFQDSEAASLLRLIGLLLCPAGQSTGYFY